MFFFLLLGEEVVLYRCTAPSNIIYPFLCRAMRDTQEGLVVQAGQDPVDPMERGDQMETQESKASQDKAGHKDDPELL